MDKCNELSKQLPEGYIEYYERTYQLVDDDNEYTQLIPRIKFFDDYYLLFDGHLNDDLSSLGSVYDLLVAYIEDKDGADLVDALRKLMADYANDIKNMLVQLDELYDKREALQEQLRNYNHERNY